ncbi:TonB-dependent receptor [Solimonas terrae]|uniref:TonB-dependent receptor n=1 Tax=Solimonas terrae TaxID=1396819 RepID=A0A6M2BLE9_9GAMM|nr:TonB-dependent receptor [Solimonas terrae]NGY03161.1 TonB-dependent receptor [Solimonas terrae]
MPKSIERTLGHSATLLILACATIGTQNAAAQAVDEAPTAQSPAGPQAEQSDTASPDPTPDETPASPEAPSAEAGAAATPAVADRLDTIPVPSASAPAPVPPPDSAPAGDQIAEVVVTATKRKKSLRDIPASITEFDGSKLEEQGKQNLTDYLQQAPGVTLTSIAPSFPRISMRGISTDTSGLSPLPSPTGIFIGDVAFSDPYISNVQPDLAAFDLASVDVLKGPQGTLFGGAALAGAIRYVLNDPVMGEWQARAFTQYERPQGGSSALSSGVMANLPLYSDRLALRVGYVRRNYPGVLDLTDPTPEKNVDHGGGNQYRAILAWQPIDALEFKLTHLSQTYSAPNASPVSDNPDRRENSHQVLPAPVDNKFQLDSLQINWDISDSVRAVSLSSYTTKDATVLADATAALIGQPPPGYPAALGAFETFDDNSRAFAQELRLQSNGGGPLDWLVGAYFYDYSVNFDLLADTIAHQTLLGHDSVLDTLLSGLSLDASTLYDKTSLLYAESKPKAQERALFFDISDTFWDHLELEAGARVYSTQVKGGFYGTGVLALAENGGQDIHYENNAIKENGVSPKFTATWHFSHDISVYTQAARGFRFGGLQSVPSTPTNHVPPVYKSDSLWNYEIGLRTAWLENRLHADLTVFDIEYKDPQLGQTTTGLPFNYTDNVGGARSKGLEANMLWLTPIHGLTLALDGALTDSRTTKPFTASNGDEVSPGTQMPGAAKSQYSAEASYFVPVGVFDLGTRVNYVYIGKGYSDIVHSVAINDYGTLNAGITFGTSAWALQPMLALNVSNILDRTAVVAGGTGTSIIQTSATSYQLNMPRTYSARLSLSF